MLIVFAVTYAANAFCHLLVDGGTRKVFKELCSLLEANLILLNLRNHVVNICRAEQDVVGDIGFHKVGSKTGHTGNDGFVKSTVFKHFRRKHFLESLQVVEVEE